MNATAGVSSPFRFDEDLLGTTVILGFRGHVIDTNNPGELSTFTAKFDMPFTGLTPQQILAMIIQNGEIFTPFSARKVSVEEVQVQTPEPATLLTFGAGTALLAVHRRRRAKKAQGNNQRRTQYRGRETSCLSTLFVFLMSLSSSEFTATKSADSWA